MTLASRLEPSLRLARLDTEAQRTLAARYAIRGVPTLILLHRGRGQARRSGAMGRDELVRRMLTRSR